MYKHLFKRSFYTNHFSLSLPKEKFSRQWAIHTVAKMTPEQMLLLKEEIIKAESKIHVNEPSTVSNLQLRKLSIAHGIPFVGFGFLDNAVMILAGEYIDVKLGVMLGITTMAAAGLGNLISDVMGLGTVGYVESLAIRLGVSVPLLTAQQRKLYRVRFATNMGRILGISIGCLLGMFPLLLFDYSEKSESQLKSDDKGISSEQIRQDKQ